MGLYFYNNIYEPSYRIIEFLWIRNAIQFTQLDRYNFVLCYIVYYYIS